MFTKFSLAIIGFAIGASAINLSHEIEEEAAVDPCNPAPTDAAWINYCDELAAAAGGDEPTAE